MTPEALRDPVMGFLPGYLLKVLNDGLVHDSDGKPIENDELYCISMTGVHKVEDEQ